MHDALAVTARLVEHASGACTSIHPGASALLTPYRGKEDIIISSRHRLDKTSADICSNTPVLRDTAKKGLVADVDSFPSPGFDEKYYRVVVCIKNIRVQVTTQHLSNVRRSAYHELSAAHQYSARHRPVPSVLSSGHWQKAMLSQQEGILMTATTCTTLKN